jgi:hypothetical protein
MTVLWTWGTNAPDRSACGVSATEDRAKRAAAAAMRGIGATAAIVEAAALLSGGAWLEAGYRRTGTVWTARIDTTGRIRWAQSILTDETQREN